MARSNDVQYVRYYSYGSAAEKMEVPAKEKKKVSIPKPKLQKVRQKLLKLDALAVTGIAVAAVMLACMLVGLAQVSRADAELTRAQVYVANLEAENERLRDEYERGYDLTEIRVVAEAIGLVPVEEVRHITVSVPEYPEEMEPTWWEQFVEDFKALFA